MTVFSGPTVAKRLAIVWMRSSFQVATVLYPVLRNTNIAPTCNFGTHAVIEGFTFINFAVQVKLDQVESSGESAFHVLPVIFTP